MPKAPMDELEIARMKQDILDVAALIVLEQGYQSMSMRKIGNKMGMTAANLYHYFKNKDEINIAIRKRAGRMLYDELEAAYEKGKDLPEKARIMMKAYVLFGITKPRYYEIMFDASGPKYTDYIGTALEEAAREELESSVKNLEIAGKCVKEFIDAGYGESINPKTAQFALWSQLHGIVSLFNNGLLAQVDDDPEKTVEDVIDLAYRLVLTGGSATSDTMASANR